MSLAAKPAYTIPELVAATAWSRGKVMRFLRANGVRTLRSGRSLVVTAAALKRAMPDFFEALCEYGLQPEFEPGEYG